MDKDREKTLKQSFVSQKELYQLIKNDLLDFGQINTDCSDQELGSRYRAREELKKEIRQKFKAYELLS